MARKNGNGGIAEASRRYEDADEIAKVVTQQALSKYEGNRSMERAQPSKKKSDGEPPNKLKLGLSDLGATVFAQGFNEGWGWLMRAAGRWSVDGVVAEQNDMLQASLPTMGGLIWYLLELYGLAKAPSAFKMGRMEAAKLLHNLGLQKFWAALRSRNSEAKKALEDSKKEIADYLAKNKDLEAQIARLQAELPGGKSR